LEDARLETAIGNKKVFSHTVTTTASRDAVWRLWTDTDCWNRWDLGLRSASSSARYLHAKAEGHIISCSGQRAKFKVTEWVEGEAYKFETALPLATLSVRRSFEPGPKTQFTHLVQFSGPLAALWALILGQGFRRALPPTMEQLSRLAEGNV